MALASTSTLSEGQDNDLSSIIVVMNVTNETNYDGQVLLKHITDIVNNTMKIHHATPLEVNLSVSTGGLTLNTYTSNSQVTGPEVTVVPVFIQGGSQGGSYASEILSAINAHLINSNSHQNFKVYLDNSSISSKFLKEVIIKPMKQLEDPGQN